MEMGMLVVNDDVTCRDIVSHVLQCCNYEELHTGRLMDALNAIGEKKDKLKSVITNVHRLGEEGSQILNRIRKKLNSEIIAMMPDDKKIEWNGGEISVAAYVLNVSSIKDMNNLWEFALAKQKAANQEGTSAQLASKAHDCGTEASRENTPSVGDGSGIQKKRKGKETQEKSEQSEASGDDHPVEKKPRVVWTKEMHRKFLEAIETLGPDKTFPKKIVELMNEPGLTRENVASHLQKYRMCLKRNEEEAASSDSGINPFFHSFHSASSVNSLQRYSYVKHQPYGFPSEQGSCGIISKPSLGLSRPFAGPRSLTSLSNLRLADVALGGNQGIQQLCTPNISFNQAISQESNFAHSGNAQCSGKYGLMQMQSKYFTRHPMNSSFRIYGDDTKNMLLSTEDGSSSSNATMPSNSQKVYSFIGLRFTGDGKSLEFGQTSVSGNNEINTKMFSPVGTSGTEILYDSNPLASSSYAPEPPNTPPQQGSNQIEVSDYCPSNFNDCSFEQEPFLAFLASSPEENASDCPSQSADCTFQQNHALPHPCVSGNLAEFNPSTSGNHIPQQQFEPSFPGPPASWNSSPTPVTTNLHHSELSFPPLCTQGNAHSLQYLSVPGSGASIDEFSTHSLSIFSPQQEISSPLEASVNGTFTREPSTSTYRIPLEESSLPQMPPIKHELDNFPPEEDINALLNEKECSSPLLFWEGILDYALLNHVN